MSVYEMAGAYTTFANDGIYNRPIYITKIEDKNGRIIYQELPEERQALQSQANYAMVQMLKYVTQGAGGMSGLKSEIGGKTGTTNDYVDGWFMGITPGLVVSTWVGGEDRWIRFLSLADGQGARMARPFFAKFIRKLEADPQSGYDYRLRFKRPAGDLAVELDCGKYKLDELQQTPTEEEFVPDFDEVPAKKPDDN
jgi:penicillin-binding protein 1A